MAYRKRVTAKPAVQADEPERLSQNGHLLGIGIYGVLVLVGFMFGIVTGYERPRPTAPAVAAVKKDAPKPDTPSPGTPKPSPKLTPDPGTTPPKDDTSPKIEPKPKDPIPPKKDPPKKDDPPMVTTKPVSFQKEVLPIFRSYCLNCHGDVGKPKGDVDLRTIAAIKRGGGGPILEIGKPEKSALYTTMMDGAMPPNGKKPTRGEIEVIRNWILTGANPRRAVRNRRR